MKISNASKLLLVYTVALVLDCNASDSQALLNRPTWQFSKSEIESLNAIPARNIKTIFDSIETEVLINSNLLVGGDLLAFRVVDLNGDGKAEMLAVIDISGRGKIRSTTILARENGKYYCGAYDTAGLDFPIWQKGNQQLLIADSPLFELYGVDPKPTFPLLYAWNGSKCTDVSASSRDYYERVFQPELRKELSEYDRKTLDANLGEDGKRITLIELIGSVQRAQKLEDSFGTSVLSKEQASKLNELISHLSADLKMEPEMIRELEKARNYLCAKGGIVPDGKPKHTTQLPDTSAMTTQTVNTAASPLPVVAPAAPVASSVSASTVEKHAQAKERGESVWMWTAGALLAGSLGLIAFKYWRK